MAFTCATNSPDCVPLTQPIDRIASDAFTTQLFVEHSRQLGVPVVMAGFLDSEPEWNLDYLRQQLGEQELRTGQEISHRPQFSTL
jgi:hypothetical protein